MVVTIIRFVKYDVLPVDLLGFREQKCVTNSVTNRFKNHVTLFHFLLWLIYSQIFFYSFCPPILIFGQKFNCSGLTS